MRGATQAVVGTGGVIVSPKKPPEQFKVRIDPDLIKQIHRIAERTHRGISEVAELLLNWAVERSEQELELLFEGSSGSRRKKPEGQ